MATSKESTLAIRNFKGINRFNRGTLGDERANQFETLQNYDVFSDSELRTINGTDIITDPDEFFDQTGIEQITGVDFLETDFGRKQLIIWGRPETVNTLWADFIADDLGFSAGSFTPIGGTNVSFDLLIIAVGPGGQYRRTEFSTDFGLDGVSIVIPDDDDIPQSVVCFDFYAKVTAGTSSQLCHMWIGSLGRRGGGFVRPIVLPKPNPYNTSTTFEGIDAKVIDFSAVPVHASSGSLVGGRRYYFASTPYASTIYGTFTSPFPSRPFSTIAELFINRDATKPMIATLPLVGSTSAQANSLTVTLDLNPVNNYGGVNDKAVLFISDTPEDMMAVGHNVVNGLAKPQPTTPITLPFGAANVSLGGDTITVEGLPGSLDSVTITFLTGTITGISSGSTYYIVGRTGDTFGLSLTPGGAAINLTAVTGGGTFTAGWVQATWTVLECPFNSRNGVYMIGQDDHQQGGQNQDRLASSLQGMFINASAPLINGASFTTDSYRNGAIPNNFSNQNCVAAVVIDALPFVYNDSWQLIPHFNEKNFSTVSSFFLFTSSSGLPTSDPDVLPDSGLFWYDTDGFTDELGFTATIFTQAYQNKLFLANGKNTPYSTNGLRIGPIVRGDGTQLIPVTKYISLVKDRIVLAGGENSKMYTLGVVAYSEVGNPYNFGTSSLNFFPVTTGGSSIINGIGLCSMDLQNTGPDTFLLVSKVDGLYSWNGLSGSDQIVSEVAREVGFAGPRSFALTKYGPIFISRENAFLVKSANELVPIGDEIKDIIGTMNAGQLNIINCLTNNDIVKIGYTTETDTDDFILDRELWLHFELQEGALQKYFTGPHMLTPFDYQAQIPSFDGIRDLRVSSASNNVFQRDVGDEYYDLDEDGLLPIPRKIVISRMGLQADHFWKVLTRMYLALEIAQNETFTFTFNAQDGTSGSLVVTGQALFANGANQLFQNFVNTRFQGRVNTMTIENTSDEGHSIFDISLLYNTRKRRLLR